MQPNPLSAEEPVPRKRRRPKRLRAAPRPPLSVAQILEWADAHHAHTGEWPNAESGWVHENRNEKWHNIDSALRMGNRSLPRSGGLARLLNEMRDAGFRLRPPALSIEQILAWADEHFRRTGSWPSVHSGLIEESDGDSWCAIQHALVRGSRGLRGGSSLVRLLAKHRGRRNLREFTALTVNQILGWADAHFRRTGRWPSCGSGPVADAPGEVWTTIDAALTNGRRGLPGGTTLARLLAKHRGHRNLNDLPPLTVPRILKWSDAHFRRTGRWPTCNDGRVAESPDETWRNLDQLLRLGLRGLAPGGSSLARLLASHRGRRNPANLPRLKPSQILEWADAYYRRESRWPVVGSGPITEAPAETWAAVHSALSAGTRGLRGQSSLAQFLAKHRGVRNLSALPDLSIATILHWADQFHRATGDWPTSYSGPVAAAPGETWGAINFSLSYGRRGLPDNNSLARLLAEHRGVRNHCDLPQLTVKKILGWVDLHKDRKGNWPKRDDGPIADAPGETWTGVDVALKKGHRGLPGGSSLPQLLAGHRS